MATTYEKFAAPCTALVQKIFATEMKTKPFTHLFMRMLRVKPDGTYNLEVCRWDNKKKTKELFTYTGTYQELAYDPNTPEFKTFYGEYGGRFYTKELNGSITLSDGRKAFLGEVGEIAINALTAMEKDAREIQASILSRLGTRAGVNDVYEFVRAEALLDIYQCPDASVGLVGGFYTREAAAEDFDEAAHIRVIFLHTSTKKEVVICHALPTEFLNTVEEHAVNESVELYGKLLAYHLEGVQTWNGKSFHIATEKAKPQPLEHTITRVMQTMAQTLITNREERQVGRREQKLRAWLHAPEQSVLASKLKGHHVGDGISIYSYRLNNHIVILLSVLGVTFIEEPTGKIMNQVSTTNGYSYKDIEAALSIPSIKHLQKFYQACKLN